MTRRGRPKGGEGIHCPACGRKCMSLCEQATLMALHCAGRAVDIYELERVTGYPVRSIRRVFVQENAGLFTRVGEKSTGTGQVKTLWGLSARGRIVAELTKGEA